MAKKKCIPGCDVHGDYKSSRLNESARPINSRLPPLLPQPPEVHVDASDFQEALEFCKKNKVKVRNYEWDPIERDYAIRVGSDYDLTVVGLKFG